MYHFKMIDIFGMGKCDEDCTLKTIKSFLRKLGRLYFVFVTVVVDQI